MKSYKSWTHNFGTSHIRYNHYFEKKGPLEQKGVVILKVKFKLYLPKSLAGKVCKEVERAHLYFVDYFIVLLWKPCGIVRLNSVHLSLIEDENPLGQD